MIGCPVKGATIAAITGVSQGAISKILKRAKDQRMLEKTGFCCEWAIKPEPFKYPLNSRIQSSDWTSNVGPHHQSTTFNCWVSFSPDPIESTHNYK